MTRPTGEAPTLDNRFHELWSQAVGSPRYVKDQWRALEGALVRSLDTRESEVAFEVLDDAPGKNAVVPVPSKCGPCNGNGVRVHLGERLTCGHCGGTGKDGAR